MQIKIAVAWLVVITLFASSPLAQERPILAVMEIGDKTDRFEAGDLDSATEFLSVLLVASGQFTVVERGRMETKRREVVADLKRESYDPCYDDQCKVELGRALAADTLAACSIISMGDTCGLACRLVPLEKEVTDQAGFAEVQCSMEGLKTGVRSVVEQLTGTSGPPAARARETPRPRVVTTPVSETLDRTPPSALATEYGQG